RHGDVPPLCLEAAQGAANAHRARDFEEPTRGRCMTPEIFYDASFISASGEELVFRYAGTERRVRTFPERPTDQPRHTAGTRGVVVLRPGEDRLVHDASRGRLIENPAPRYRFDAYFDQSLVRAPELDTHAPFDPIRPR